MKEEIIDTAKRLVAGGHYATIHEDIVALAETVLELFPDDRNERITLEWLVECGGELIEHKAVWEGVEIDCPRVKFILYTEEVCGNTVDDPRQISSEWLTVYPPGKEGTEADVEFTDSVGDRQKSVAMIAARPRNRGEFRALLEALGGEAKA